MQHSLVNNNCVALPPISYPIGVISDVHGRIDMVKQIVADTPEVTRWMCLGDVIDIFSTPSENEKTLDAWFSQFPQIKTLIGNHEEHILKRSNLHMPYLLRVKSTFISELTLLLQTTTGKYYRLSHATPYDRWEAIFNTTETQIVIDAIPNENDCDGKVHAALIIGHNHSQFIYELPPSFPPIWSVGAVKNGEYAVIVGDGEISLRHISVNR